MGDAVGKKERLARLLAATGLTSLGASGAARRRGALPILAYHRVFDPGEEDDFPYDPELVSATPREFEWQMGELARRYRPIHLAEALRVLESGEELAPGSVAVTFDDGHRDNHTHAFPILRKLGVPATIFLSTGYVGGAERFWFDETAYLLHRTSLEMIHLRTFDMKIALGPVSSRRAAARVLLARMKEVPNESRLMALDELRRVAGVGSPRDERSAVLSWEQVLQMRDGGVDFGSHTVTHPILSRLGEDALRHELSSSRRELESRLGREVALLAYPVGNQSAYDERSVRIAGECGYRLGLTYVPGVARWPPRDRFALPRLHVERYTTREMFAAMLAFPRVFA